MDNVITEHLRSVLVLFIMFSVLWILPVKQAENTGYQYS